MFVPAVPKHFNHCTSQKDWKSGDESCYTQTAKIPEEQMANISIVISQCWWILKYDWSEGVDEYSIALTGLY